VTGLKLAALTLLVVLAAAAGPGGARAANECQGVTRCVPVEGPWVAVPAHGEVDFELSCPAGRGIVAGTDGYASSVDVHATFDAILGSPIAYGRTTNSYAFFRAVSGRHRPGSFKPFIGCIPTQSSVRNTIAAKPKPVGPPLDLRSRIVALSPGLERTVTVSCPKGEFLVDSWNATAFSTKKPPATPGIASAVQVHTTIQGHQALLAISASEALSRSAGAEVQLGVRCAAQ
jgi:hypothetical protein